MVAFRTPGQAIAAAVKAAGDELKSEKTRIGEQLVEAQRLLDSIKAHETTARSIIDNLKPGEVPKTVEDRTTVEAAAVKASAKPPRERSASDFRAVVIDDLMREDWEALIRDARAMSYFYADEPENLVFALFQLGWALEQAGKREEAIQVYTQVAGIGGIKSPETKEYVIGALYNKACLISEDKDNPEKVEEALGLLDQAIAETDSDETMSSWLASSMVNKAAILSERGDTVEATRVNETMLARFESNNDEWFLQRRLMAQVNRINNLITLGKIDEAHQAAEVALDFYSSKEGLADHPALAVLMSIQSEALIARKDWKAAREILTDLVARFSESANPIVETAITSAFYNLACGHAVEGKVRPAVAALERWRERRGSLDCEKIRSDGDFDRIREKPAFRGYLRRNGCP